MKNLLTLLPAALSGPTLAAFRPGLRAGLPLLLFGLGLLSAPARAQSFSCANQITPKSQKSAVTVDKQGTSYVLTAFTGTVTADGRTFTSLGGTDLLLVKYHDSHVIGWATRIGSTGDDLPGDVIVSPDGKHVYLTAAFRATATLENPFDNNNKLQAVSAGGSDVLVAKYESGGKPVWARRAGGSLDDSGNGIDLDNAGNVYLTGSFAGTMKFPLPLGSLSLTSSGQSDAFVAKYNQYGTFVLAGKAGGAGFDFGKAIAVDKFTGAMYVTGGYSPSTNPYITNILLAKFYASGGIQWIRSIGTASNVDQGNDLVVTNQGVYVTGYFAGSTAFDAISLTSSGPADAFVAFYRYDSGGKATWAKRFGGGGWD
ncbi:MAG: SBBP repeat-containing protein, partial [Cytophagales bacterium]|nr:SBBP repeat-containing protein [Cytophagales bacterium]